MATWRLGGENGAAGSALLQPSLPPLLLRVQRRLALLHYGLQSRWRWMRQADAALQDYMELMSCLLHEPQSRCKSLLHQHLAQQRWLERRRHQSQSPALIHHQREAIVWPQRLDYQRAVRQHGESRIMAAFHFGDYVHCLAPLARMEPPWRRRILIRQQPGSHNSEANLECNYLQMGLSPPQLLQADEIDLLQLRCQLRRELCTLTTFCDLPASFGVSVPVQFLGQTAWFSCGPAALAISAGVPMLPVITWHDGRHNRLQIEALISSELRPGETQRQACCRLTQALVDVLQCWLLRYPAQWRYLSMLPTFFNPPATLSAASDN